jgi:Holliday junction resolvase
MAQPEAKLSRKIMAELKLNGYFCFKVHGSEYMMAGLPDIIVCAKGLFIGLETKMPDKRDNTSMRQEYVHGQIRAADGIAEVVCSPTEAIKVVRKALRDAGKR